MSWAMADGRVYEGPYSICREIRGYSIWFRSGEKFGRLGSEITTLDVAKKYCADHAAKLKSAQ